MPTHKRPVFLFTLLILILSSNLVVNAQSDDQPAPEFLYRDGNHLILVNGYTGETSTLPIEVDERDRFEWSPDGRYLLAHLLTENKESYCLNLFDVDQKAWLRNEPISCLSYFTTFSLDGSEIYYTTNDKINGTLWVYSLVNDSSRELYQTTDGEEKYQSGISALEWSPTNRYLAFSIYKMITGGSINSFIILNVERETYILLTAPDTYYANYAPIWSDAEHWFLIILKEEYVTSGSVAITNHQGDLYLVNPETGEQHRLTYTPASYETDIHWTDDGEIAFTEVTTEKFIFTLDQAMNIEAVSTDQIKTPEPLDGKFFRTPAPIMISPDPNIAAWVRQNYQPDNKKIFELVIGSVPTATFSTINFSVAVAEPKIPDTVLIGWRPSDYPYSGG